MVLSVRSVLVCFCCDSWKSSSWNFSTRSFWTLSYFSCSCSSRICGSDVWRIYVPRSFSLRICSVSSSIGSFCFLWIDSYSCCYFSGTVCCFSYCDLSHVASKRRTSSSSIYYFHYVHVLFAFYYCCCPPLCSTRRRSSSRWFPHPDLE